MNSRKLFSVVVSAFFLCGLSGIAQAGDKLKCYSVQYDTHNSKGHIVHNWKRVEAKSCAEAKKSLGYTGVKAFVNARCDTVKLKKGQTCN